MDYDVQIEETFGYWIEELEEAEGNVPALPTDLSTPTMAVADDDLPF